jgi:succinate dehydrogenase / fumarate reductase cytochrome b subunit
MSNAVAQGASGSGAFLRSRLASVLAIAPLGVWTVLHVWDNLAAYQGAGAWEASVTGHKHPVATWVTSFVVLAPLLIHTVWGVGRLRSSRPNNLQYGTYANVKYLLQRLSAVGVLLFLGAHIWLAFLRPRAVLGHAETFADISREMHHHTPTLVVYLLGTLGVAYHLANGLYGAAMGFGLVATRKALNKLEVAAIAFFVILLAMSWGAVYALYRAGA